MMLEREFDDYDFKEVKNLRQKNDICKHVHKHECIYIVTY